MKRPPRHNVVHSTARLFAPDACERLGFKKGDLLTSDEWATPRKLRIIDAVSVEMAETTPGCKRVFIRTFPKDIRKVDP